MLEKYLIQYCSPTLASLKTASVFRYPFTSRKELEAQIYEWNEKLRAKGISIYVLRCRENMALIYVCRTAHLEADIQKEGVREFLAQYGYKEKGIEGILGRLRIRLMESAEFPHEIGLFLGYPLGDVQGFIKNVGKNSKCSGYWKVYCNEYETVKVFQKFRKCKDVYLRLWGEGRSVLQLTVASFSLYYG